MDSFRENLKKKIEIDGRVRKILLYFEDTAYKSDLNNIENLRILLQCAGYNKLILRDLELYIPDERPDSQEVIVLDNDLPLFETTPEEVALRKSPTVKEMLSFRNAVKILNDGSVVRCKKKSTIKYLHQKCIERLNITYSPDDIKKLYIEGKAALDADDNKWVKEILTYFAELAGWLDSSLKWSDSECFVFGKISTQNLKPCLNPAVIYKYSSNELIMTDEDLFSDAKEKVTATLSGYEVLSFLKNL